MKGFRKIRKTCRVAAREGIKYAWVDTCCIDKTNSAELSEAINTMYKWYQNAKGHDKYALGVALKKTYPGRFARTNIDKLVRIPRARMMRLIRCPGAYIATDMPPRDLVREYFNPFKFLFPQKGGRVVKAWPPDKWNDAKNSFMTSCDKEEYGSLLMEMKTPTLAGYDDGRSGEFMFLFSSRFHYDDTPINPCDLQYTIVGYREHQLVLDILNLRMGTGDIDVQEMRQTLVNFAIPSQQTAAVPIDESGQYIYASVERGSTTDDADETIEDTIDMEPGLKTNSSLGAYDHIRDHAGAPGVYSMAK
ncbi:Vegetative incompatibility protein HET-E-1 [Colletotrichum sp. SAR11_59]|nr:Vegetative incompatibility protein HET-E-1 [Colletotrichum sp. SAR11_59]